MGKKIFIKDDRTWAIPSIMNSERLLSIPFTLVITAITENFIDHADDSFLLFLVVLWQQIDNILYELWILLNEDLAQLFIVAAINLFVVVKN